MERPTQVTALSVIAIITGVLQVIAAAMLFGIMGSRFLWLATGATTAMYTGWALLILGAAGVIYGIGAWTLSRWSWSTGIVVAALDVLAAVYIAVVASFAATVGMLSAVVLVVLALVELSYLFMHDVRTALSHEPGGHPAGQTPSHA